MSIPSIPNILRNWRTAVTAVVPFCTGMYDILNASAGVFHSWAMVQSPDWNGFQAQVLAGGALVSGAVGLLLARDSSVPGVVNSSGQVVGVTPAGAAVVLPPPATKP